MAPSETSILEQFLLAPAQLPTFLSLEDFAALFRSKAVAKSSAKGKAVPIDPSIRALYRDLQRQRGAVVDSVAAGIEDEVARGRLLRRYALRERLRANAQEDAAADDELQIELLLRKEDAQAHTKTKRHSDSLMSTVGGLGSAVEDVEAEVRQLEEEEAQLLQTVQQAVGRLSDLRYGRLSNPQLRDQVLEGLDNVQATCDNLAASSQKAA